ncbi:MAG: DUF6491 family protein [Woeseiaceae bacterium]|nr:DUF6491 family protein [Woeseiaceae bacterium]
MKRTTLITAATLLLAGCSMNPPPVPNPAVEDFIIANQLETADRVKTRERDGWVALNNRFVIWNNRRQNYLLEFRRECKALTNTYDKAPDLRLDQRTLRARVDTLRGCMISHIYLITTDQRKELKNLGDAPGS